MDHHLGGDGGLGSNLGCGDGGLGGGLPLKRLGLGCAGTHGCPRLLWRRRRPGVIGYWIVVEEIEEVLNVEVIW